MGLRETLNEKPIIARTVVGVAFVGAIFFAFRGGMNQAPDSLERRSETVTIRDTETGDEWTMNRGEFERLLLLQQGSIDENGGIPSQFSDGKPTGVLIDKNDWTETVNRINAMKKQFDSGG
tara:strand:+ start:22909 stop:23271 length:363 start_codon:yes stop_codon:yes gene_type:complete